MDRIALTASGRADRAPGSRFRGRVDRLSNQTMITRHSRLEGEPVILNATRPSAEGVEKFRKIYKRHFDVDLDDRARTGSSRF